VTPNGLAVAEAGAARVTFRGPGLRVVAARTVEANGANGTPVQLTRLPTGNLLAVCQNLLVEYDGESERVVFGYVRMPADILAAARLADGRTFVYLKRAAAAAPAYVLLDAAGKELPDKPISVGPADYYAAVAAAGPGRVLVSDRTQVAEYDLTTGKAVWTRPMTIPLSLQRLPSGNTLVVESGAPANRVVELSRTGEEVWSYTPPASDGPTGPTQVLRAYRE
jgi:outer membrane protein assembly factor BamB